MDDSKTQGASPEVTMALTGLRLACKEDLERMRAVWYEVKAILDEAAKIPDGKRDGNSGEELTCTVLGLKWNTDKAQGADAFDSESRPCEIKCAIAPKGAKSGKVNFNYPPPTRKKDEKDADFVARVRLHYLKITGGHYWTVQNRSKSKILAAWWLPAEHVAELIAKKIDAHLREKPGKKLDNINFGSTFKYADLDVARINKLANEFGAPQKVSKEPTAEERTAVKPLDKIDWDNVEKPKKKK
jgi:hypothetical protein